VGTPIPKANEHRNLFFKRRKDMNTTHDAIIIGTGQAGPPLANRLCQSGMRVAVMERHLFGGTCVNTGCIPTKTMVASAYAAHLASRGADFGFSIDGRVKVDLARVKTRKDAISGRSREGLEKSLNDLERCDVIRGHARFRAPREVVVGDRVLHAERIFLNVGGRAAIPAMPGVEQTPYLTNTSLLDLTVLPEHLVIVGGSYVGLEFGQMFRRFGSQVTIVEMASALIRREDADVSNAIRDLLIEEGIAIRLNARCINVSGSATEITAHVECSEGDPAVRGTHLLLATGRRPNTDDLGLDAAGIKQDDRGYIVVDDELRTSAEGVWALGDCNGRGAFTHTSYNDYEIVAANLLDGGKRRVSDRLPAYALYIDPPLGRAGLTEAQVRDRGKPALVGTRPMTRVGRAIEKGETKGFMKFLVDAGSREILGASILGTGGDEAIHCVLDTMYAKAPCDVLQRAVHIHPTVSELIPTVLGELKPLQSQ
jgi:pyruvate/2-oxoglutarate dehydrogenase complex dihydrolipoamide dehydrogenase (E3) component